MKYLLLCSGAALLMGMGTAFAADDSMDTNHGQAIQGKPATSSPSTTTTPNQMKPTMGSTEMAPSNSPAHPEKPNQGTGAPQ